MDLNSIGRIARRPTRYNAVYEYRSCLFRIGRTGQSLLMHDVPQESFELGAWLVEPDLNQLTMDGVTTHVEPKTMAVLVLLYRRAGTVVSVDEIVSHIWGQRPMGDNPVYKSIAKLRNALGENPKAPKFIHTVARMGYRLIPELGNEVPVLKEEPVLETFRSRIAWPLVIGVLVGVSVATMLFWRPLEEPITTHPLATFSGSQSQPTFAPDGNGFAFVSDASGTTHIWLTNAGNARQLTHGSHSDSRPRYSPDSATILFGRGASVWAISTNGGNPTELIRAASNANYSADGSLIVFERNNEVWIANADGGGQQRIEGIPRPELALAERWPALSPDGQTVAFLDAVDTPLADLWTMRLDGGKPTQLTFAPALASAPAWSPDGRHIVYSTRRGGSRTLWRVDVNDRKSIALLTSSGDDDFPDFSRDGSKLIYSNSRERFALVASDLASESEEILYESRLTLIGPELSPDGTRLAYFGERSGGDYQIFVRTFVGGESRMITSDTSATHALPRWSPDGNDLYFFRTGPDTSFSKVAVAGGEAVTVVDGWNWNTANGAQVSPSGETIIYSRLSGHAPVQTFLYNLRTGVDKAFHATLEYPRWTRDGHNVVGAKHGDQRFPGDIVICNVEAGPCRVIARDARIPVLSFDETQIYFVRGFGRSQELFVTDLAGTAERRLMTMAPLLPLGPFYAVTPDGRIVWVRHETETADIWIMNLAANH